MNRMNNLQKRAETDKMADEKGSMDGNKNGEVIEMPNLGQSGNVNAESSEGEHVQSSSNDKSSKFKYRLIGLSGAVITVVISVVSGAYFLGGLNRSIDSLESSIKEVKESIGKIDNKLESSIKEVKESIKAKDEDIVYLKGKMDQFMQDYSYANVHTVKPTSIATNAIGKQKNIIENEINSGIETQWASTDILAEDFKTKEKYTAAELVGKPLILPYEKNGQEVYFYGQYNELNQWDEKCTINVYENNKLILITEALYDNGKLISYKQVLSYISKRDKDVWIISERVIQGDYNSGQSWSYIKGENKEKSFNMEDVKASDILTVDKIKNTLNMPIEAYYNGNTSNGSYNDTTGKAYLIKFFEDGTVRTLYQGKFKDGKYEDDTGEAWYITKEIDTPYMYFKGTFSNGNTAEGTVFKYDISLEEIKNIVNQYSFNYDLKWFIKKDDDL